MLARSGPFIAFVASIWTVGCAHHATVGRPPTANEIEEINRETAQGAGTMLLHYVDPEHLCGGGVCTVDGPRPTLDTPPLVIERITEANDRQMAVVAETGDVWHLDLSTVGGVTTRSRATGPGAVAGAAAGLAFGGVLVLFAEILSEPWPDAPVTAMSRPVSAGGAVATVLVSTTVGAIIGSIVGHRTLRSAIFDFGGGHFITPSSFSR
jgi:hypothetical protein